ncbi:unnamed protein product [Pieris brassicae]|uniref:Uncharacterized protein n=1 Tax=Pieris brassicae TaxID=7116 RepID=A0A9P0TLK4_PIEBR|nr:unnamed protein product [Pieris brassicae]
MFILVGCRRAAPKYCASMWWCLFICVMYTNLIGVLGSNTTAVAHNVCTPKQFQCANGMCIHMSWVCEGEDDCGDNSDENIEECKKGTCLFILFIFVYKVLLTE